MLGTVIIIVVRTSLPNNGQAYGLTSQERFVGRLHLEIDISL